VARDRRAFIFWAILVGIAVLLAGCRVDTRVEIKLQDDGSGTLQSTITFDADAVDQMGGAAALEQTVPLSDLRSAGWTITPFRRGTGGTTVITFSHPFINQRDLAQRIVDLAGPRGILQHPNIVHDRGWFSSHDAVSIVIDVRTPAVGIVNDTALAARLRAAGTDPAQLEAVLAVQLKSALHVSVIIHLPGGLTKRYDAANGSVKNFRVKDGGVDWDRVVKFGIGVALALLAVLFFLAATVGIRRNRRRAAQRIARGQPPERVPLM
jgi:hypothetical protein